MSSTTHDVVLFDGVCNFCESSVQFIIKRDPRGLFHFASLQSDVGRELLTRHGLPTDHMDSLVLFRDGEAYICSDAALRIAGSMTWPWSWLKIGLIFPRFLRDFVYSSVAARRYKIFGKKDACTLPPPEIRARFL